MSTSLKEKWLEKLKVITPDEWESLKEVQSPYFYSGKEKTPLEWCNLKFYEKSHENDGLQPQALRLKNGRNTTEIPYKRNLYRPSSGRFGFGEESTKNVIYLAGSWLTATCEAMPSFRENPNIPDKDMVNYMHGELITDTNIFGYPINLYLSREVILLNVEDPNSPFLKFIEKHKLWESAHSFYQQIVFSQDSKIYPITHAITEVAYAHGFDGIKFKSVRKPRNSTFRDSEGCLVLYKPDSVIDVLSNWEKVTNEEAK